MKKTGLVTHRMTKFQKLGRNFEEFLAKNLNGFLVPGSGSHYSKPGDIKTVKYLVQAKATTKASATIRRNDLKNIRNQALDTGKIPIFALRFAVDDVSLQSDDWLMLPLWYLKNFIQDVNYAGFS